MRVIIYIYLVLLLSIVTIIEGTKRIESICPKQFTFTSINFEDGIWKGTISLTSNTTINNAVIIDLEFDKPLKYLKNSFGVVSRDSKNTKFMIRNKKEEIIIGKPLKVHIKAVYDDFQIVPPNLIKIKLNGKEICANNEDEGSDIEDVKRLTRSIKNDKDNKCGISNVPTTGLFTDGQDAIKGQWPWHAALYKKDGSSKRYLCGGTLISDRYILTAAHCVTYRESPVSPQEITVSLGKYNLLLNEREEQKFTVMKVHVHEEYDRLKSSNDIAILQMDRPVQYTEFVRPICLWSQNADLDSVVNKIGSAVGWRIIKSEDRLTFHNFPVVQTVNCILSFGKEFYGFLNENNFCAGYKNGTFVGAGESGSGLVFPKPGTSGPDTVWEIRGILAIGVPSKDMNGPVRTLDPKYYIVFTDVAKHLDWIKDFTKPSLL